MNERSPEPDHSKPKALPRRTSSGRAGERRGGKGALVFALVAVAFLGIFLVYPVLYVVDKAFFVPPGRLAFSAFGGPAASRPMEARFSLAYFKLMLQSSVERECLANSFSLALATVLGASLLAFPMAVLSVRYRFFGKRLLTGLLLAPMIMPPFVGAIGMKRLLAREGSINLLLVHLAPHVNDQVALWGRAVFGFRPTVPADLWAMTGPWSFQGFDFMGSGGFWAIALMQVLHLYPIMYLNVAAALANVDPSLEDAARNLGDRGLRMFRRVTLPLMLPGYLAGAILVFVWAFTDLGTPLIFGFRRVIAVRVFDRLDSVAVNPMGYANVVAMVMLSAAAFLGVRALGRSGLLGSRHGEEGAMVPKGITAASERVLGPLGGTVAFLSCGAVIVVAVLPHLAVVLCSFQKRWSGTVLPSSYTLEWYRTVFSHELVVSSIRNSLFLSLSSALLDVVLGVGLALVIVRSRLRFAWALDALAMIPLAIPGLVLAFGYVTCFGHVPWLNPRANPMPLLVAAYAVRRLPFMLRSASAGLQQTSSGLEEASRNLGATPWRTICSITIPLLAANVVAGAVLVFSFAMLEVSDSLVLAFNPRFYPITKAIYSLNNRLADGPFIASAMGVLAMGLLAGTLLFAGMSLGKRLGEIFRA